MYLQQQGQDLHDQHVALLQQHIALAAYAEDLEAATAAAAAASMAQQQQAYAVGQQCPQPLQGVSAAAAVAAAAAAVPPPVFPAAQGLGGWVLRSMGQEADSIGGLQGALRSSSAPRPWGSHKQQQQQQQQVQQPLSKLGRLQSPQVVLGLPVVQQPGAAAAAAAAAAGAGSPASSSRSSSMPAPVGSLPAAAAGARGLSGTSKWLHSSLSSWVHLGHSSHKHTGPAPITTTATATTSNSSSKHGGPQGLVSSSMLQQQVGGLAPPWWATPGGGGVVPEPGVLITAPPSGNLAAAMGHSCSQISTAGLLTAEPSAATTGSAAAAGADDHPAGVVLEGRQARADSLHQQGNAAVLQPSETAAVRRTLEQAAATLAAAAPAGAAVDGKVGRKIAVSCPGKVAFSQHLLSASSAGGAAAAAVAAMCPAMSIDIPQQASRTDGTPRGGGVLCGKPQAVKSARRTPTPPRSGRVWATHRSSCGCEGSGFEGAAGLELVPGSTTDLAFDQVGDSCCAVAVADADAGV